MAESQAVMGLLRIRGAAMDDANAELDGEAAALEERLPRRGSSWRRTVFLTLLFTIIGAAGSVTLPAAPSLSQKDAMLAQVDSLLTEGQFDSAFVVAESLMSEARAARDSTFLLPLLVLRGRAEIRRGHDGDSEAFLREAVLLAQAGNDSASLCEALRWLAEAASNQGRLSEALELNNHLLEMSRASDNRDQEGYALLGIAKQYAIQRLSDSVLEPSRQALAAFEQTDNVSGMGLALCRIGETLRRLGSYEAARDTLLLAAELGRRNNLWVIENRSANGLGNLEYYLGDPAKAMEHFRYAYELQIDSGTDPLLAMPPAFNTVNCLIELDRLADAEQILDKLIVQCRAGNYIYHLGKALVLAAYAQTKQNHYIEAARIVREALDLGDQLVPTLRAEASYFLSTCLAENDSLPAAIAVLEESMRQIEGSSAVEHQIFIGCQLGELLVSAGRHEEGLVRSMDAAREARRLSITTYEYMALSQAARAARELGLADSCLTILDRARDVWESVRTVSTNPEWREQRGSNGRLIFTDLAGLLLRHPPNKPSDERIRAAFDALQPFKARTLMERIMAPGETVGSTPDTELPPPVTLSILQQDVLSEKELFLDYFLGPQESFLFAVTQDECRVVFLPPDKDLGARLLVFHELLATPRSLDPEADPEMLARSGEHLGRLLLEGLGDLIERKTRILVAPDGPLNLIPFAELRWEPDNPDSVRTERAATTDAKEWLRVPSATILAWQRQRTRQPDIASGLRILAIAARETESGEALAGAVEEVRRLERRYVGVEAEIASGDNDNLFLPASLAQYDVLHLAAHTRLDDQHPWNSEVWFSRTEGGAVLRAGEIAGMQLSARLAVLSSCESAGGRVLSGEGVQGLCSAFLSAGVPAVIATLWPVDDHTTSRLMETFYSELARDETVARSLQSAQLELKAEPGTRDPFFWAGFVLVGDGGVRVPLERRQNVSWLIGLGALLVLALVFVLVRDYLRARRST